MFNLGAAEQVSRGFAFARTIQGAGQERQAGRRPAMGIRLLGELE
jgi:hypothetical protein